MDVREVASWTDQVEALADRIGKRELIIGLTQLLWEGHFDNFKLQVQCLDVRDRLLALLATATFEKIERGEGGNGG